MQTFPRISIVTPSFNQGQFLEQTIRSVLSQGYPNLEYIIIDGGSTDGSVEIIKRYEKQIFFWCSEKDKGHYDAINKGFSRSTGDILAWINSDDIYFPWTLMTVATMMSSVPEVQWLSSLMPAGIDYQGFLAAAFTHCRDSQNKRFWRANTFLVKIRWSFRLASFSKSRHSRRARPLGRSRRHQDAIQARGRFRPCGLRFFQHADLWGCPIPLAGFRSQFQQRSSNVIAYRQDANDSLNDMRKSTKWSKWSPWRRSLDVLGLSRIWLTSRIIRKTNYYLGLKKYLGLKLHRERCAYPDANWVPIQYRF